MNNQGKIIVVFLVGFISLILSVLFVINPTLAKVTDLNGQATSKKTELKQLQEQIVIYKNAQHDLSLASGKDAIAGSLLLRVDLETAVKEIEDAATKTGVAETLKINDTPANTKNQKPIVPDKLYLDEIPYSISTTSNFPQLLDFIQYLEHLPHFTEISKVTVQAGASATNSNSQFVHSDTITATIESVFFVQKNNETTTTKNKN